MLEELVATRRKSLMAEYGESLPQIRSRLAQMLEIANTLKGQTLVEDETDKHITTIVERGKTQVISVITKAAGDKIDEISKYEDLADVSHKTHRILKMIGDVLGRQTRVIHIFAKKYAVQLKRTLSELNDMGATLARSLKVHESFESTVASVNEQIQSLELHRATASGAARHIKDIEEQISTKQNDTSSAEKEIAHITESKEYIEYGEISTKISKLNESKDALGHKIDESFARISRPLSKYIYVSSLEKATRAIMSDMLESPSRALFSTEPSQITLILEHVGKAIESASISVKDPSKAKEQLGAVSSDLPRFYEQIGQYVTERKALDTELQVFDSSSIDAQEAKRTSANEKIAALEAQLNEVRTDAKTAEASMAPTLQRIQAQLRFVTNIAYTVDDDT